MSTRSPGAQPLLEISDLAITYTTDRRPVTAVSEVTLHLDPQETLVLAGESGCGKTTLALAVLGLLPRGGRISSGTIVLRTKAGERVELTTLSRQTERELRWSELSVVFQGAMNSLNPLLTVRQHFLETARAHAGSPRGAELDSWIEELMGMVMLEPERVLASYPHQLSGGMRQRVLIALGLLLRPRLVVLDEPTTALDVLTQKAIITILRSLQERIGFAMIFITHDLALAAEIADRVAVMYGGRIVELGTTREVFTRPGHPYTQALLGTIPRWDGEPTRLRTIKESLADYLIATEEGTTQSLTSDEDEPTWLSPTHVVAHLPRRIPRRGHG
ncbi:MAG: ABC transporter ATP-binding protein [Arachnia propionica]|uniref:ABC transporter ATP-binding protein n=1 Tax=Arachnia propionica TaxID=1750 RepID=UPI0026F6FF1C|nr:ABC transporter ATP-binding protein [Arachnia propionica]